MTIWVDENIPLAEPLFGQLGEVRLFSGRGLQSADLKGAEALIVRSVTPVNRALLADSKVRFVGTATIGVDHLDMPWLQERGITYCSAPGSNAQSVAEYVLSALAALDSTLEALVDGGQVGIIGFGNVGRQLARCRRLPWPRPEHLWRRRPVRARPGPGRRPTGSTGCSDGTRSTTTARRTDRRARSRRRRWNGS